MERSHPSMIHPTAIITDNVEIGKNVIIGAYSVIGTPAECKYRDNKTPSGKVYIGDNTIIREHVTIHAPEHQHGITFIGNNCYIQAHSHIGHDTQLGNHVTIACYGCIGGYNIIHSYCNVGLHAVTHQRTTVKKGTILGANSFSKGVIDEYGVYVGIPSKRIKDNQYILNKLGITLD